MLDGFPLPADDQRPGVDRVINLVAAVVAVLWLTLVVRANADLLHGRHVLFMDERITYDEVKTILLPQSARSFLFDVLDGGDHRYGRLYYSITAVFAFPALTLFGPAGFIFAGRMLQASFLLLAWGLTARFLLLSSTSRLLFLIGVISLPGSAYYSTMPKPEPLQILALTIFFILASKRSFKGGPYWVFLGIAFGLKISALPIVIVFFASLILVGAFSEKYRPKEIFHSGIHALLFMFSGWALTVPIVAPTVLAAYMTLLSIVHFASRPTRQGLLAMIGIIAIAAMVAERNWRSFNRWLDWTFRNTSHGADRSDITPLSWLDYASALFLGEFRLFLLPVLLTLVVSIVGFVLMSLTRFKMSRRSLTFPLSILLSGTACWLSIFANTKRLWHFYLFPGAWILLLGFLLLLDLAYVQCRTRPCDDSKRALRTTSLLRWVTLGVVALLPLIWAPNTVRELSALSERSAEPGFLKELDSYDIFTNFVRGAAATSSSLLRVSISPENMVPESDASVAYKEYWSGVVPWQEEPDIVILSSWDLNVLDRVSQEHKDYPLALANVEAYSAHVGAGNGECAKNPCYLRVVMLPNGGELLAKRIQPS